MLHLLETAQDILAKGSIDSLQMELLRRQLYGDGGIDRQKVNVLVGLHRRIQFQHPAFERLYYKAVKDHLLACERLGAQETEWLRQTLCADGAFTDEERTLLHELMDESRKCSPDFEILFKESLTESLELHTCC